MTHTQRFVLAISRQWIPLVVLIGGCVLVTGNAALAVQTPTEGIQIPTGQTITPTAAAGSVFQDLNPEDTKAPEIRASHAESNTVIRWLLR